MLTYENMRSCRILGALGTWTIGMIAFMALAYADPGEIGGASPTPMPAISPDQVQISQPQQSGGTTFEVSSPLSAGDSAAEMSNGNSLTIPEQLDVVESFDSLQAVVQPSPSRSTRRSADSESMAQALSEALSGLGKNSPTVLDEGAIPLVNITKQAETLNQNPISSLWKWGREDVLKKNAIAAEKYEPLESLSLGTEEYFLQIGLVLQNALIEQTGDRLDRQELYEALVGEVQKEWQEQWEELFSKMTPEQLENFQIIQWDGKDYYLKVLDTVAIDEELARAYLFANPQNYHAYWRYLMRLQMKKEGLQKNYLEKRKKMMEIYRRAKSGEGRIRYQGKVLDIPILPLPDEAGGNYELVVLVPKQPRN